MMGIQLSGLSVGLGLLIAAKAIWGLWQPVKFRDAQRRFPRSLPWGYFFIALATGWFLYNLSLEAVSDFVAMKKMMYVAFVLIAVATCLYVRDFLAVRGLAMVMLLLAKLVVDTARWVESDWRLVLVVLAYIWVILGMWLTISPWRLRDMIYWKTANEGRIRTSSGFSLAFGVLLIVLGVIAF